MKKWMTMLWSEVPKWCAYYASSCMHTFYHTSVGHVLQKFMFIRQTCQNVLFLSDGLNRWYFWRRSKSFWKWWMEQSSRKLLPHSSDRSPDVFQARTSRFFHSYFYKTYIF